MAESNIIINFPYEKESTPEELFLILIKCWEGELKIYKRIMFTLFTVFLIALGINIVIILKDGFFNALLNLLSMIISISIAYIFIRLKYKPRKPTMDDALEWRRFKDKVVYEKQYSGNDKSEIIPINS